jgi:hypothetical protein
MRFIFLTIYLLFASINNGFCQDKLYTVFGKKIIGKVIEIGIYEIQYTEFKSKNNDVKFIYKSDVVLIEFENGTTQIINPFPREVNPKFSFSKKTNRQFNPYYLSKNLLSINALALSNGDITLIYDREFFESKLVLSFLGGYNINKRMGGLNYLIADSKDDARKKSDLGLGIDYMLTNTKQQQFYIGFLSKYMTYDYQAVVDTTNNQRKYTKASGSQLAVMATGGCLFRIASNFNLKVFISLGKSINSTELKKEYNGIPKLYLGYCFGYRF